MAGKKPFVRPIGYLQACLNTSEYKAQQRGLPRLSTPLLAASRNGRMNDLLEFLGDRVVNLVLSILVDRVKIDNTHHTVVRRVICQNDTFGRLAFYLKMHEQASLEAEDSARLLDWNPQMSLPPPKVLADLFEAYVGSVYIQHGWKRVQSWLDKVFEPIVFAATGEYWTSAAASKPPQEYLENWVDSREQSQLLSRMGTHARAMEPLATLALEALPSGTQFTFHANGTLQSPHDESLEVAGHVLNLWICTIAIDLWPQYLDATRKAAHLFTGITDLVTSELSLSLHGNLLGLPAWMDVERPTSTQSAACFKTTVAAFHQRDRVKAREWAHAWFRRSIMDAHQILTRKVGYRPIIPALSAGDRARNLSSSSRSSESASTPNSSVDSLLDAIESLAIGAGGSSQQSPAASAGSSSKPSPKFVFASKPAEAPSVVPERTTSPLVLSPELNSPSISRSVSGPKPKFIFATNLGKPSCPTPKRVQSLPLAEPVNARSNWTCLEPSLVDEARSGTSAVSPPEPVKMPPPLPPSSVANASVFMTSQAPGRMYAPTSPQPSNWKRLAPSLLDGAPKAGTSLGAVVPPPPRPVILPCPLSSASVAPTLTQRGKSESACAPRVIISPASSQNDATASMSSKVPKNPRKKNGSVSHRVVMPVRTQEPVEASESACKDVGDVNLLASQLETMKVAASSGKTGPPEEPLLDMFALPEHVVEVQIPKRRQVVRPNTARTAYTY